MYKQICTRYIEQYSVAIVNVDVKVFVCWIHVCFVPIFAGPECQWSEWVVLCRQLHDCSLHTITTLTPHHCECLVILHQCYHYQYNAILLSLSLSLSLPPQVSSTPSSLLVAWATPDCNGEPITAYCIELSGGHMANHMIKVATTETQYTISDLKASTQYRFVLLK